MSGGEEIGLSSSYTGLTRASAQAAAGPEVGMGFHEMYSYWHFVTAVTDEEVQVVQGGGHPSWFPMCGLVVTIARAKFPEYVRFELLSEHRYEVAGWADRAAGLTFEQFEEYCRIHGGGQL